MFDPEKLPAAKICRAMDAAGLACSVCAILPFGINPISPDVEVRKKSNAHLVKCVEVAVELGATLIGGPMYAPIGYLPGRRRNADEWSWAIDSIRSLGSLSSKSRNISSWPKYLFLDQFRKHWLITH